MSQQITNEHGCFLVYTIGENHPQAPIWYKAYRQFRTHEEFERIEGKMSQTVCHGTGATPEKAIAQLLNAETRKKKPAQGPNPDAG